MAIWVWLEPFGDIWGSVLFRVMSGKEYQDLGMPLMILGSVIFIFGVKNFLFLAMSPEFKGFLIEEYFSLRDERAIIHDATPVEKE